MNRLNAIPLINSGYIVNPKKIIFFTIFLLTFLFSGIITMLHIIPYRMGLTSALIIPLIFIYGLKVNRVLIAYLLLVIFIGLSALFNYSSIVELIIFLRILVFSYLIYYLVEIFIDQDNISKIIKLCIIIAVIQLPIIIFQQAFYDLVPDRLIQGIYYIDFDFGTFNANDAPLSIFLILIVIFLLFDKKHNYIIRYKWPISLWLTLTVFVVNSELSKIIIMIVWVIYLIRYLNIKVLISSLVLFSLIFGILAMTGVLDQIWTDLSRSFSANITAGQLQEEAFLSGSYGRGAAVAYYLNQSVKWFGDGPSKYYNVFSNIRMRGNTGHIFTFYSEVGLFGWLLSVSIFFLFAFPVRDSKIRISWVSILSFVSLMILSFTTQIMNDISIVLIYLIVIKSYLVPQQVEPMNIRINQKGFNT